MTHYLPIKTHPGRPRLPAAEVWITTRLTVLEVAYGAAYRSPMVLADHTVPGDLTPRPAVFHRLEPVLMAWVMKILPRIRASQGDRVHDAWRAIAVALRDGYVIKRFGDAVFQAAMLAAEGWKPPAPPTPHELWPSLPATATWDETIAAGGSDLAAWRKQDVPDVACRPLGRWVWDRGETVFDPLAPSGPEADPKLEEEDAA